MPLTPVNVIPYVIPAMASVHKLPGKPNWICFYSTWDTDAGRWHRRCKSTGTTNKTQAEEICRTWEKAAREGRKGTLSMDAARDVISRGVADVFLASNHE